MIQPVNNISFKAIWEKSHKYNTQQSRTITEIKAKLGERTLSDDFLIEPSTKENSVILYKFDNLKSSYSGQRMSYDKKIYIGTYNPQEPFQIKDLKEAEKFNNLEDFEKRNKIATLAMIGISALLIILSNFLPKKPVNESVKTNIEQIVEPVVDSIKIIKRDTINFLK